ncbi:MMPL family transporter [Oceanicoccus sp. KOV_DT_Chl]|uniref:MMPL family transporter n=1 Tax=Oceanicoccus sp. KOV_DT_Chl TaxID=1904639 RepID=UPI000C7C63DC|nr:MMPL family transporter [Oceanicoccus sp. KOV_DT_Chl]
MQNNTRTRFSIWCVLTLTLLVVFAAQLYRGLTIDSDILGLLPESERSVVVQQALDQFAENFSQQLVFLVGANERASALAASDIVYSDLQRADLFSRLTYKVDGDFTSAVFNTYLPYRTGLLSKADRDLFADNNTDAIKQQIISALYSPVSPLSSSMLAIDPLFLLANFLAESQQQGAGSFELYQNVLLAEHQQSHYVLITAELNDSPFNMAYQDKLKLLLSELNAASAQSALQYRLITAGVPLHAIAGTDSAKHEISLIGGGSLVGIVVLIFWVFRSVTPIAVAVLAISIGVVAATVVCTLVFGKIHILSMVFGASLVGVSIDYSFHYFCEGIDGDDENILTHILPGISFGLVTSLIGYLALFIAPFPGLHQMAVFSSVGLLAAYFTVVGLYPVLLKQTQKTNAVRPIKLAASLLLLWQNIIQRRQLLAVLLALGVALLLGVPMVQSNDDIRLLRNTPDNILAMESTFTEISGARLSSEFFLVTAASPQAVLEAEESLLARLGKMETAPAYQALTASIPSIKRQTMQRKLLLNVMSSPESSLYQFLLATGFDAQLLDDYVALLVESNPQYLALSSWLDSPAASRHRQQWIANKDGSYASIVFLYDLKQQQAMRDLANEFDDVEFIDQVGDVSQLFKQYRQLALQAVFIAYSLIFLLLLFRYRLRLAILVILPPLYAAAFAMAVTVLFGYSINLFSMLALLLVLAIGIDYTIFYAESRSGNKNKTALAIALSCATTLLAFGLLALSDTPAIKSFGLTIAAGIAFSFLLSPIASFENLQRGD